MPRGVQARSVLTRWERVAEEAAGKLRRELVRIEGEKERLTADLDSAAERIRNTLAQLGHSSNGKGGTHKARQPRVKGKRVRRSADQLKREADAIYQLVKSAGAEGAAGRDIRKHHPKVGPDIKGFIQKYTSHKVKTTGKKASTRYLAA